MCSIWSLGDLTTSFELSLPLFDCLCKPHVLTEVTIIFLHLHKLWNAHLPVWAVGAPDNLAARRRLGSFGTLRTKTEQHAGLHPSAVAFHRKPPRERQALPPWFLYREMVLSSQVFIRGCTALSPEQTLLFGGYNLSSDNNDGRKGQRVIDDWIIVEGAQCIDSVDVLANARRGTNTMAKN